MKFGVALLALSTASLSFAWPIRKPSEFDILNFALTLENVESAFYSQGLQNFTDQDFTAAGFNSSVRIRYTEIAQHEATHVEFLKKAIGPKAVKPCTYQFPVTTVQEFVALSKILETVGTSAYSGAAHFLTTPEFITSAAAILATEARQSTFISSSVLGEIPWSTSFEAPLDLDQAFTLASPLIVSCPKTNVKLPVKANNQLALSPATATPGQSLTLSFNPSHFKPPFFAAFVNGLDTTFVPINSTNGAYTTEIPGNLTGVTYILVSTSDKKLEDSNTVAGPAIDIFQFA